MRGEGKGREGLRVGGEGPNQPGDVELPGIVEVKIVVVPTMHK